MKKLIVLLLIGVLSLTLAACTGPSTASIDGQETPMAVSAVALSSEPTAEPTPEPEAPGPVTFASFLSEDSFVFPGLNWGMSREETKEVYPEGFPETMSVRLDRQPIFTVEVDGTPCNFRVSARGQNGVLTQYDLTLDAEDDQLAALHDLIYAALAEAFGEPDELQEIESGMEAYDLSRLFVWQRGDTQFWMAPDYKDGVPVRVDLSVLTLANP